MTATSVVCPECGSPVAPGRLSCQSCGTLLASVVGSTRRYAAASVVDPMLPDVDEDRPIASARRGTPEPDPPPGPAPIVVDTIVAAPPTQPAKRAPRRLPRPKPAAAPVAPVGSAEIDAQTSIFGPVPNVAPPILQDWSAPTAQSGAAAAAPMTRTPRPPRNQPVGEPVSGSGVSGPAAFGNGATAAGTAVAGAYLAPSATYAAPVVDRAGGAPPTATGPGSARTALSATTPAPAAWPSPTQGIAPAGSANGASQSRGPAANAAPTPAQSAVATSRRMSDWLVIGGATLAIVSFVLPWATDGVLGSHGIGYTAEWGLANLGHLWLIVAAGAILVLHLFDNRVPAWIRSGILPIAIGGLFGGLSFAYYAKPFGGGSGVAVLLAGAVLLLVGGVVASRPERHEASTPDV